MNEAETRAEHIDPALKAAGWGVVEGSKILREYPITPKMSLSSALMIFCQEADLRSIAEPRQDAWQEIHRHILCVACSEHAP